MSDKIWITWEHHRRSTVLAEAFGAQLHELTSNRGRIARYFSLTRATIGVLRSSSPSVVFAQNPSLVLGLVACILKPFFGYRLVVDRHSNFKLHANALPQPQLSTFQWISKFTIKHADLTIVTNAALAGLVESWGGRAEVLQDKIPNLDEGSTRNLIGKQNLLFVCTYSDDEPVSEVLEAASLIDPSIAIYVSGNYRKWPELDAPPGGYDYSSNVRLTGFVDEIEYQTIFRSVDAAIVLTTRENLLTCGAYEAIALNKPLVLSNSVAIKEYFRKGARYTDNSAGSIAKEISKVCENIQEYRAEVREFRRELSAEWNQRFSEIQEIVRALQSKAK